MDSKYFCCLGGAASHTPKCHKSCFFCWSTAQTSSPCLAWEMGFRLLGVASAPEFPWQKHPLKSSLQESPGRHQVQWWSMKILEGILFSDFQICLQIISHDMDPNNSAIIATAGITIMYSVYFLVMHTGNHAIMLAPGQLLQEMRLHRLLFWYSFSSMPLPYLLANFILFIYFFGRCVLLSFTEDWGAFISFSFLLWKQSCKAMDISSGVFFCIGVKRGLSALCLVFYTLKKFPGD